MVGVGGVERDPGEIPDAFWNRSGERETGTKVVNGTLESERAGKSAPGGYVKSTGLEHFSGGQGVK